MRADRLLSLLMILQNRGKTTAQALAAELEVSERTVYRDVIALSSAGVPVYADRGPGGGISLIEQYRSDLTGLNKDEVRALFTLAIPPALGDLGLDGELKAALRKLSAALPSTLRADEQNARQRIHIDPTPWQPEQSSAPLPHLLEIQRAVWEARTLEIRHRLWMRPDMPPLEATVYPYGLVAKAGHWYLVAGRADHIAVIRIDRVLEVRVTSERFERPADFDLAAFWRAHCHEIQELRLVFPVIVRLPVSRLSFLYWMLKEAVQPPPLGGEQPDSMGRITRELRFEYFEQARERLLPLGNAVEVIEPLALRYSIQDYAAQILAVYS
jgi:predicted DNA-binding transcriptional regulator YafY